MQLFSWDVPQTRLTARTRVAQFFKIPSQNIQSTNFTVCGTYINLQTEVISKKSNIHLPTAITFDILSRNNNIILQLLISIGTNGFPHPLDLCPGHAQGGGCPRTPKGYIYNVFVEQWRCNDRRLVTAPRSFSFDSLLV